MCFTIIPACVTQLFSLRWHRSDGSLTAIHWLLHFLFLGLLYRYLFCAYPVRWTIRNYINFAVRTYVCPLTYVTFRYLTLFYAAIRSLRNKPNFSKDRSWVYRQESDICMLHLFESFMGAAPQLILQVYIIVMVQNVPVWTSKYPV